MPAVRTHPFVRTVIRLATTVAAVVLGALLRQQLTALVGEGLPTYITFYPAVMVAALVGGLTFGLVGTAIAALVVAYWVLPPHGLAVARDVDTAGLGLFCVMGVFLSAVAELYTRSRRRAAAYEKDLALQEAHRNAEESLRRVNAQLAERNAELTRQAEELSQQTEELSQQAEELSQQAEELSQQNEELHAQGEEIRTLNVELGRRENLLQTLLESARLAVAEEAALRNVCAGALEMFGETAAAVAVYEKKAGFLAIRTTAGIGAVPPEPAGTAHRFVDLVIEQNRTASLNDVSLRPDLSILAVRGEPPFQAVLAAPLQAAGQPFGAVAIYSRQKHEWSSEQFRLADWLAGQCAHILEILRLQADLRRQAALMDLSPDAIIARQVDGTITLWGRGAERLYGWTRVEAIGQGAPALLQTRFPEPLEQINRTLQETGRWSGELIHTAKDGREVVVESRWLAERNAAGRILEFLESNVDITARKRIEDALRGSEARYAQLFDSLLDGFAYCRMLFDDEHRPIDFVYVRVNQAFERLTGLHDVVGRRVTEVIPGIRQSNPELFDIYGRVATTGQPEEFETYLEPLRMWLAVAVYRPEPDHFVAVFDNVTDRKRALEALRESDRRKSEFLATLSHELRNPLAPIRYALELLRCEGDDSSPAHPKRVIERQMGHMVHLVDDLLDVTRIASNKIRLRRQRVNLGDVVEQAVEATAPDIEQAGHSLVVSLPPGPLWLDADPDRLAQVLTNLLNNAARYTPHGGRLALTAAVVRDEVVISVSDTGVGLGPDDRDRVFEMFTQLGEPGQGGLGIGLALVKGLVELHGGRIEARSDGPGRGSEFLIRLPRAEAPSSEAANVVGPREPGVGRRVLVVDDNLDSADMLKTLLELHGHEVRVANDGASALAVLQNFVPNIGLFDIGLPGMSGYDLARRVREDGRYDGMFLVALTGWGQEEDRQRARECGFNAHLTKPADPADLHRVIARAGNGDENGL